MARITLNIDAESGADLRNTLAAILGYDVDDDAGAIAAELAEDVNPVTLQGSRLQQVQVPAGEPAKRRGRPPKTTEAPAAAAGAESPAPSPEASSAPTAAEAVSGADVDKDTLNAAMRAAIEALKAKGENVLKIREALLTQINVGNILEMTTPELRVAGLAVLKTLAA